MASHADHIRAILEALHQARENFDRAAAAALLTENVEQTCRRASYPIRSSAGTRWRGG